MSQYWLDIILALQITAVGMGLVFGSIFLLWGVMALLVRITPEAPEAEEEAPETKGEAAHSVATHDTATDELTLKRRAAAAAVMVALAQHSDTMQPHDFPLPATAQVSAWQAVNRTKILSRRGSVR